MSGKEKNKSSMRTEKDSSREHTSPVEQPDKRTQDNSKNYVESIELSTQGGQPGRTTRKQGRQEASVLLLRDMISPLEGWRRRADAVTLTTQVI